MCKCLKTYQIVCDTLRQECQQIYFTLILMFNNKLIRIKYVYINIYL